MGVCIRSWLGTYLYGFCTLGACTVALTDASFSPLFSVDSPSFLFRFGCRMSCSLLSLSTVLSQSCGGIFVVSVFASPPIAATIQSSGGNRWVS